MGVIVDTSVWSLVLRRSDKTNNSNERETLVKLIEDGLVKIIGPIRKELLSDVKTEKTYDKLKNHLEAFPNRFI